MIWMAVGIKVARIRNRDVAKQQNGTQTAIIVFGLDRVLHSVNRIASRNILAHHGPSVANQVLLQAREFGGKLRNVSVIDHKQNFAARFDHVRVYASVDIPGRGVTFGSWSGDLVFVSGSNSDVRIGPTRRAPT